MAIRTDPAGINAEYQQGLEYQRRMKFPHDWAEYDDFKASRQWPAPTKRTADMPRPVINITRYIVKNKKSNVLAQPVRMIFSAGQLPDEYGQIAAQLAQGARDFTDFTAIVWDSVRQDRLNRQAVEDGATVGTGIWYYYWDPALKGGNGLWETGGIAGETIDAINFFCANPQDRDVQRQPWAMISSREDTDALISKAAANGQDTTNILPDSDTAAENYTAAQTEMDEARKTTCLTKFYHVALDPKKPAAGYQVYWTKVTVSGSVIQPPMPLTPPGSTYQMQLYPLEVFNWYERKKCIFGIGEIEGIIPTQRALNFSYGMMLLSIEKTAWPSLLAKEGVFTKKPTNVPGEVLWYSGAESDPAEYLQPPNFTTMPISVSDKLVDMTRTVTGTTEVMSGEAISANMAASAIIALQNQAKIPIEDIQDNFYDCVKGIGRIWEEFYKAYYSQPRIITGTDQTTGEPAGRKFVGTDYAGLSFGLDIDVGPASQYSDTLVISTLDNLLGQKIISSAQYAKYMPDSVFPQGLRQEIVDKAKQDEQMSGLQNSLQAMTPEQVQQLRNNPQALAQIAQQMKGTPSAGTEAAQAPVGTGG